LGVKDAEIRNGGRCTATNGDRWRGFQPMMIIVLQV